MAVQSWTSSVRPYSVIIESPMSKGEKIHDSDNCVGLFCQLEARNIPQPRPKPTACFSHLFAQKKRFKTKLRRGFCCCKSRTLYSLPKPWKLIIISNKISQNSVFEQMWLHILSVLVDNDVFARGIIWQDLPRIKWTVIKAFETLYSYATVMFTMLPFALVPETAEAAQTLELSCKCLASYKPWHKASLAVEFILWWWVIPNSSRSCVENKLQQGRHQAVAISGRSNKQIKKLPQKQGQEAQTQSNAKKEHRLLRLASRLARKN